MPVRLFTAGQANIAAVAENATDGPGTMVVINASALHLAFADGAHTTLVIQFTDDIFWRQTVSAF